MDINIKIDAPELSAAIAALAYSLDGLTQKTPPPVNNQTAATVTTEAVAETVQAEPEPPKPEEKPAETKSAITFEDLRKRLAPISQSGKQSEIKALLTQFGAAKLSDVPPEKYESFLAAVEGL